MNFERLDPTEECYWYGGLQKSPYSLDYLYFFIGNNGLATERKFSETYLNLLRAYWKIEKDVTREKIHSYRNFWYFDLYTKDQFLKFSDKVLLANYLKEIDAYEHKVFIGNEIKQNLEIAEHPWYVKSSHGFSGRGNSLKKSINALELHDGTHNFVVEEYLNRKIDFAITLLENEKIIIYENIVSSGGQYLGTKFLFENTHDIEKFLASYNISKFKIDTFVFVFEKIRKFYCSQNFGKALIGSFDFFIYESKNELNIHPCCEFNPRWTMGRVAWEISQRYRQHNSKAMSAVFNRLQLEDHHVLSPPEDKIKYQVKWSF